MQAFPAAVVALGNRGLLEREHGQVCELVVTDGEAWEHDEGVFHVRVFDGLSVYGDNNMVCLDLHDVVMAGSIQDVMAVRVYEHRVRILIRCVF